MGFDEGFAYGVEEGVWCRAVYLVRCNEATYHLSGPMLSAKHLPFWNVSLPSILGPEFSEPGLRVVGSLDISASHLAACRPLPNLITNCLGARRCGDGIQNPTLPKLLSSLTTDTFFLGSMLSSFGELEGRVLF